MRKLMGAVLVLSIMLTLTPSAVFAEEERTVYKSSENFSTAAGDGTWDGGIWSAQTLNPDTNVYTNMQGVVAKASSNLSSDSAESVYSFSNSSNNHSVGAEHITPPTNGRWSTEEVRTHWAVKTFTAPRAGKIKITSESIQANDGSAPKARVRKGNADGSFTVLMDEATVYNWKAISDETETTVAKGETIHFEIVRTKPYLEVNPETGETTYKSVWPHVYWDPVITYTEGEEPGGGAVVPEDRTEYKSSENFSTKAGDGTWDGGIWIAQTLNPDTNVYTNMQGVVAKASSNLLADSAESVYSFSNSNNNHSVGAEYITPPTNGRWAATEVRNHWAVKTFVAPKSGFIKITAAGEGIIPSDSSKPKVRVRKSNADGSFTVLMDEKALGYQGVVLNPGGLSTKIDKGESIHFEILRTKAYYSADIYQTEGASHAWVQVYWDPVITYTEGEEPGGGDKPGGGEILTTDPEDKVVYRASEAWSLESNGDYAWKWQYYDIEQRKYFDMSTTHHDLPGFALDGTNTYAWINPAPGWNPHQGEAVGEYGMRISVYVNKSVATDGEKKGEVERNHVVRTFTAPKRGEATIGAALFNARNQVYGTDIRIMKHSTDGTTEKIYPADDVWMKVYPGEDFVPLDIELEKGDKLTFELCLRKSNSAWNTTMHWDPVITYTKVYPALTACSTKVDETDVPLNREHILTYNGDIIAPSKSDVVLYEISADGKKLRSDAEAKSIEAEGKELKIQFGGLKPMTKYEAEINGVSLALMPNDKASSSLKFTTGPVVNIGKAEYKSGKITVPINNSADTAANAALAAFLCKGTEKSYTIENVSIMSRTDIGANDSLETTLAIPGSGYFIKVLVLEDVKTARAYAPMTVLKGEK